MNRELIEKTKSLEEAVEILFGIKMNGRTLVLFQEGMGNGLAEEYDDLGRNFRSYAYGEVADDFVIKINPASDILSVGPQILDVGCGSGILDGEIMKRLSRPEIGMVGIDVSEDMLALARKNVHENPHLTFRKESVYELSSLLGDIKYIVCRNALHRFRDVRKALHEMYSTINPGGKIYLRDLRRDADWRTIVQRIGEPRWKSEKLVEDYIRAMAQTLTTEELGTTLISLGIDNFKFTKGKYSYESKLKEFGNEVEYVCVIKKD